MDSQKVRNRVKERYGAIDISNWPDTIKIGDIRGRTQTVRPGMLRKAYAPFKSYESRA